MSVKFTGACSPYNAGEIAGFQSSIAKRLVEDQKVAEYVAVKKDFKAPADAMVKNAPVQK